MRRRPLAIDLCCGIGGWSRGLILEGWDVVGFDVQRFDHPRLKGCRFPGPMVVQDVRTIDGRTWRGRVDLIVASPPCTEFSRRRLPWRNGRPELWQGDPDLSVVEACRRIALEAGAPLVLENVQGAVRWIGRPVTRAGPFYLWGDGVPPLLPQIPACKGRVRQDDHAHTLRPILRAEIPSILGRAVGRWHRQRLEAAV